MRVDLPLISALARRGRIDIIRTLRQNPNSKLSINDLSRISRVPIMTCWRAVKELERLKILDIERVANSSIVTLSMSGELMRFLRQIPDSDPHRYAAIQFSHRMEDIPGISQTRLFGKVAKGDHAADSEADIAVVYDHIMISSEDATAHIARIADDIEATTGTRVVPHLVRMDHLEQARGFAAELRDKEIIWKRGVE